MKKLIESIPTANLKHGTHIDVEVSYYKGNVSTRGFYITATPVKHERGMSSYMLFSNERELLMPASRFSAKQFAQACKLAETRKAVLIQRVLEKERAA